MRRGLGLVGVAGAVACSAPNPLFGRGAGAGTGGQDSGGSAGTSVSATGGITTGASDSAATDAADGSESDGGTGGEVDFTDDEWRGEFAEGTRLGVVWENDALVMTADTSLGGFDSRIFDAGRVVDWDALAWQPSAPYRKPLPDGGVSEVDYLWGNADMAGNTLLLHLNDSNPGLGSVLADSSGQGNDAYTDGIPTFGFLLEGVFGRALATVGTQGVADTDSYFTLPEVALAPGAADFTWSVWFRNTECTTTGSILMVFDSPGNLAATPSAWIACVVCSGGRTAGLGTMVGEASGAGSYACEDAPMQADGWHHAVLVKSGHRNATIETYFDGQRLSSRSSGFEEPLDVVQDVAFTIGGSSDVLVAGSADFDEVAIWNRALSESEVHALYSRGASRLAVRVRACDDAECTEAPQFIGPEDVITPFVDPPGATGPGTFIPLTDVIGRYIQYRLIFNRGAAGAQSPELSAVTLLGH